MSVDEPLLALALILLAGVSGGQLARWAGLPSVTGQIVVGIGMGPSVSGLLHHEQLLDLQPLTHFALGLIAVTIGSHLQVNRLLVAKRRLALLLLAEATITPLLVVMVMRTFFDVSWSFSVVLGALAISTAPATVVALIREAHATGVFVRTLLASVALNNLACLCWFEIATTTVHLTKVRLSFYEAVSSPLVAVLGSVVFGAAIGLGLILATLKTVRSDRLATASMVAILLTVGTSQQLGLSSLIACLAMGLILANVTPDKEEIGDRVFRNFEGAILAIFFILAGAELDFAYLLPGGAMAVALVSTRIVGKLASARTAMAVARAPASVQRYLGWALVPQAGVAVGLLLSIQDDPSFTEIRSLLLAVGLSTVIANELIGPIATRWALRKSGEAGKDRARIIDFLHEENITTQLQGDNLHDALLELTDLLWTTHRLPPEDKADFLTTVRAEEKKASSYLGGGLAIPHGTLHRGTEIVGVMGLSRQGLATEDSKERIHCIVLLATPDSRRDRHLQVLAAFARAIGGDRNVRQQLYDATSPAHAYLLLHHDEAEDFNYFLDDAAA